MVFWTVLATPFATIKIQFEPVRFNKNFALLFEKKDLNQGNITYSVVISRPWSRDSSALKFLLSRSRSLSRDLKSKVSVLVSRPKKGLDNNTDYILTINSNTVPNKVMWMYLFTVSVLNKQGKVKMWERYWTECQ